MSTKHRPVQVMPKAVDLLHPADRMRFLALRTSYLERCSENPKEKPDSVDIDHAICKSAAGLSLHEVLADLGWTITQFEKWCQKYPEIRDLKETMELALKAHLDRLLNESIRDDSISLPSLQLRMRHHSDLFTEDIINIANFSKLNLQEKATTILDLLAKGAISLKDSHKLLDVLGRIEELASLPDLAQQVIELKEAVQID